MGGGSSKPKAERRPASGRGRVEHAQTEDNVYMNEREINRPRQNSAHSGRGPRETYVIIDGIKTEKRLVPMETEFTRKAQ